MEFILTSSNIVLAAIIFCYVFLSAFSFFLPCFLYRGKEFALKFSFAISLAFEIVVGYIFYSAKILAFFPLIYFIFIGSLYIISVVFIIYQKKSHFTKLLRLINIHQISLIVLLVIPIFFTRYYDAFINIAAGNEDTYGHITFLKNLVDNGYIQQLYYAPGFHIYVFPLTFFLDITEIYRFTGPALGVLILINYLFLFKDFFKRKLSWVIFALILCIPIYNGLILTTISFWATTMSLFFLPVMAYITTQPTFVSQKILLFVYAIFTIVLSITVPYLFVQLIPIMLIIYFISKLVFRIDVKYSTFLVKLFIITVGGLLLAFTHVYIQTKVITRDTKLNQEYFPQISVTNSIDDENKVFALQEETIPTETDAPNPNFWDIIKAPFIKNYLVPLYNNGIEILSFKLVRKPWQLFSFKTYIWEVIAIIFFVYYLLKKQQNKFIFSFFLFNILFGVIQITGIFESTLYRGRSGFYFLFFSALGIIYIIDYFNKYKIVSRVIVVTLFIYSVSNPPVFSRQYCIEPYNFLYSEIKMRPDRQIVVISNDAKIKALFSSVIYFPLTIDSFSLEQNTNNLVYVIMNKHVCYPKPSQEIIDTDINLQLANLNYNQSMRDLNNINNAIKSLSSFSRYSLVWENENVEIYQLNNN